MIGRTHGIHAGAHHVRVQVRHLVCGKSAQHRTPGLCRRADARGQDLRRRGHLYAPATGHRAGHLRAPGPGAGTASSQVIQRDRHAFYVATLAVAAASLEKIALEVRGLQRTEVREAEEYFSPEQKGSSAMPHKRNPVTAEQICGLARVVRANAQVALENVALWHERDISHSSAERIILADSTILLDYLLAKTANLVEKMFVYPDRMRENLDLLKGLIFSGQLLLDLVEKGAPREEAYRWVQRNAMQVWETREDYRTLVERDDDIRQYLKPNEIAEVFNVERYLQPMWTKSLIACLVKNKRAFRWPRRANRERFRRLRLRLLTVSRFAERNPCEAFLMKKLATGIIGLLFLAGSALVAQNPQPPFDGLGMGMDDLARLSHAKTRSISAENMTGEKGKGGMATEGMGANAARELGQTWKISPAVKIQPKQVFTIAEIQGPGAILHIWMTPAGNFRFSILRIYWDGESEPSVEVPVGDFFATGLGRYGQVSSLAVCSNPHSGLNSYWEMPFRKSARITMENIDDEPMTLYYQVDYTLTEVPRCRLLPRAVPALQPAALQDRSCDSGRRKGMGAVRGHLHRVRNPQHRLVG